MPRFGARGGERSGPRERGDAPEQPRGLDGLNHRGPMPTAAEDRGVLQAAQADAEAVQPHSAFGQRDPVPGMGPPTAHPVLRYLSWEGHCGRSLVRMFALVRRVIWATRSAAWVPTVVMASLGSAARHPTAHGYPSQARIKELPGQLQTTLANPFALFWRKAKRGSKRCLYRVCARVTCNDGVDPVAQMARDVTNGRENHDTPGGEVLG